MSAAADAGLARMVVAYVQPHRAQAVLDALHRVPGVTGATLVHAHGFGRGRAGEAAPENVAGTSARARIEVVVPEALEDLVVGAVRDAAHTGQRGDGKVYVLPVGRAVRVSTGEEGETAI